MNEALIIENSTPITRLPVRGLVSFMFYNNGCAFFRLKSGDCVSYVCTEQEFQDYNGEL